MPARIRPVRRVPQLFAGLVLYAVSMAMQVRAGLGLAPWDVLHEGLTLRTSLSFGVITGIVGVVVLLLWIPLRERPGLGTVANVLVIAIVVDIALAVISTPGPLWGRVLLLVGGVLANGLATACYVGARLGPGPRDGLMTGLVHRTSWPLRWVRTGIEVTVLALGWVLGGTVGIGTVLYALAVGPLTQAFLPWVAVREKIVE